MIKATRTEKSIASRTGKRRLLSTSALTAAGILMLSATPSFADNAWVLDQVGGSFDTDTSIDSVTNITQNSHRAIGEGNLDIKSYQTVNILQGSKKDLFVAKDNRSDPTRILGALNANGKVMVIDANGVFFGAGSQVNVGSIIASTGETSNADIMDGDDKLEITNTAGSGSIELNGTVTVAEAGIAAFVSPEVTNNGVINAKLGKVAFGAGEKVTLDLYGDRLLEITAGDKTAKAILANHGTINAEGGEVLITAQAAKNAVDSVINMDGVINVSSATVKGGKIILSGGGDVNVAGKLDASGKTGGGSVEVTGENVLVAQTASIDASAKETGDGGNIKIWGDRNSLFFGLALARGGSVSGNGGFVEVSAAQGVAYAGNVDTTASNGETGVLLIDPVDVLLGTVDAALMAYTLAQDAIAGGGFATLAIDQQALANTLAYSNVDLWASNSISTLETLNLSSENYGGGPVSVTDHDLRLSAPTINLLHDIYLGTGGLFVTDIAAGTVPEGTVYLGTVAPPVDINSDTVNLNGTIYGFNGGVYVAQTGQIGGGAGTVNVWTDAAKINQGIAFVDNGGNVNVGAGLYNESVEVNKSITLRGGNAGVNGAGARFAETYIVPNSPGIHVTADNTTIDGFFISGASNSGVWVDNADNVNILNSIIDGSSVEGILGDNSNGLNIGYNAITNSGVDGINIQGGSNVIIAGNTINLTGSNEGIGADFVGGYLLVQGNNVSNTGDNGIEVVYGNNVVIQGNSFTNIGWNGLNLYNNANLVVGGLNPGEGNIVDGTARNGMDVVDNTSALILGNSVSNTAGHGIYASGNGTTIIGLNTITNAAVDAINATDSAAANILLNTAINSGDDGIEVSDSAGAQIVSNLVTGTVAGDQHNGIEVTDSANVVVATNTVDNAGWDAIGVHNSAGANIAGNTTNTSALSGVALVNSANSTIQSNVVNNAGTWGIYSAGNNNVNIVSNDINATGFDGIIHFSAVNATIAGNTVDDTTLHGIYLSDVTGVNNVAFNAVNNAGAPNGGASGIYVYNATGDTNVFGNTVSNSDWDNIGIWSSVGVDVFGNTVLNAERASGIAVGYSTGTTVDGNIITGASRLGVYAGQDSGLTITNNQITDVGNEVVLGDHAFRSGIFVEASTGAITIAGNIIDDAGTDGINLGGPGNFPGSSDNAGTILVNGNTINNVGRDGIYGSNSIDQVIGNTINNTGDDGIDVENSASVQIVSNQIGILGAANNIGNNGIEVEDSAGANIVSNAVSNTAGNGIFADPSPGTIISNNIVQNSALDGIHLLDSINSLVFSNIVLNSGEDGIEINNSDGSQVYSNVVDGTGAPGFNTGIEVLNSDGISVFGNVVNNASWDGIGVWHSKNASITGNVVTNSGQSGIALNDSDNSLIQSNISSNSGTHGIWSQQNDGVVIDSNIIDTAGSNGIVQVQGSGHLISNNSITTTGLDGILVKDAAGANTVVSNIIDYTTRNGIGVDNTDDVQILNNTIGAGSGGYINPGFGTGDGINVANGSDNAFIDNNTISTDGRGVSLLGGDSHEVSNNTIVTVSWVNSADEGIYAGETTNANIHDNHVTSADNHGISVYGGSNATVDHNDIHAAIFNGINVESVTTAAVTDNLVENVSGDGIYAGNTSGLSITGNIVHDTGDDGIDVNNSVSAQITGNYVGWSDAGVTPGAANNIAGDGIQIIDSNNAYVGSNNVINVAGNGIFVDPSDNVHVDYNSITNAGLDGINVVDATNFGAYGNTINTVGDDGIEVINSPYAALWVNTISNATDDGIVVNNSANADIYSNTITTVGSDGILIDPSDDSVVNANTINFAVGHAVNVDNSDRVQVINNTIGNLDGGAFGSGSGDGVHVANGSDNAFVDNNTITTDGRGVSLLGGDGHEVSNNTIVTISWVNSADEGIYAGETTNANIHDNHVTAADNHGISVYGGSNATVNHNDIHSAIYNGINIESVSTAGVHNNYIENVYVDGIYAGNTSGLSITGNIIHDAGDDGIDVYNSGGANVSANDIGWLDGDNTNAGSPGNIGGDGIALIDSAGSTISNNSIINVAGNGIFVDPSPNTTVDSNIINNSGINGIYATDSDNVDITNNYVNTSGLNGILVTDSTDNYIYNNDVYNSEIDGIHVENFGDTRIKSNTVDHSGDDGIEAVNGNYILIGWNDVTNSGYNGGDEYGGDGIHVRDVYSDYGYDYGFFGGDYAVKVIDNTIESAADDGIEVIDSESVKIADNDITDVGAGFSYNNGDSYGADGIHVRNINGAYDYEYEVFAKGFGFGGYGYGNGPKVLIENNTVETTGDDGIEVAGVDGRVEIKWNDIKDAGVSRFFFSPYYAGNGDEYGADGIHVRDVYDNNYDYGYGDYGYELFGFGFGGFGDDDKAVIITGNDIDQTGDDGIEVIDSESVKISWNDIEHAGTDSHHNGYGGDYYGADGIHVRNVHGDDIIYGIESFGEGYGDGYGYYGDGDEYAVEIKHNTVHKTGDDGIEVAADYYDYTGRTLISYNDVSYAGIASGFFGFPYYDGHGDGYGADGIHVRGVINAGDYAPAGGGEDGYHGYAADILHNTVLKTGDDGIEVINTESTLISNNDIIHAGVGFFDYPFGGDDYTGADGIHVANVYGGGYGYAGTVDDGGDFQTYAVVIKDNNITTSDDDGIEVVESGRTLIKDNDVENSGVGDDWWGGADDGWGGDGIHVRNVYANDYVYDDYYYDYAYENGYDVEVIGNTVDQSADDGIEVTYNNEIRQVAKVVEDYVGDYYGYWNGIETNVGIFNNTVSNSGDDGIDVTNANYVYIDNNDVSVSGGDGITVNRDGSDPYVYDDYGYGEGYPYKSLEIVYNPFDYFPNNVVITNNTVDDSADDGIEVNGYSQIEIGNNIVTNQDDDGIIVTNLIFDSIYEYPVLTDSYEVSIYDPYVFYGTANVNIHDNSVDNSGADGIQVDAFFNPYYDYGYVGSGHTNVLVTDNVVTDSGLFDESPEQSSGLYIAGPDHGNVFVAGNTFGNNPVGARFESGLIDLTGETNFFLNGQVALNFRPYAYGEGSYAYLGLVDDDAPGYQTFPSTGFPTNFGGTIGEQFFLGQTTAFVKLENQAFWDFEANEAIWLNALNSTYGTPFGFVRPSLTGGILSQNVFNYLESMFIHYPDTLNTGIFFFGFVPNINIAQEDIFNRFGTFNGHQTGLNVTLLGLPGIPGGGGGNSSPAALNAIQSFAGGAEDGTFTPEELNAIETQAGAATNAPAADGQPQKPVNCWSDAANAAYNGQPVNYSYGTGAEETITGAAGCSAPTL